jgi:hypothetical protein
MANVGIRERRWCIPRDLRKLYNMPAQGMLLSENNWKNFD